MSLPIHVDAYSGYKANERPQAFWLGRRSRYGFEQDQLATDSPVANGLALNHDGDAKGVKLKSLLFFSSLFLLLSSFGLVRPVMASTVNYTMIGSTYTITFSIAQQPAIQPVCVTTSIQPNCFQVFPVAVTVNGTTFPNARVNFFRGSGSGLSIFNGNTILVNGPGPVCSRDL